MHPHRHSDRPKALTVRLNSASGPMVESRGQKYCRVTLGSRQHSTPKRRTITKGIKSIIEWNCVLVYPYSTEKWLKIEMLNETFMNRLACSVFDLQKLKNSENRRFTGQLELDDRTCVDVDISFYPRPLISEETTKPSSLGKINPEQLKKENSSSDEESKLEHLVNQSIKLFNDESDDLGSKSDPVLITIGNIDGALYQHVLCNPDKALIAHNDSNQLGVESLWIEMAGGPALLQNAKDTKATDIQPCQYPNPGATPPTISPPYANSTPGGMYAPPVYPPPTCVHGNRGSNPLPSPPYSCGYPAPLPSFDPRLLPQLQPCPMRLSSNDKLVQEGRDFPVWKGETENKGEMIQDNSDDEVCPRRLHTKS